jgi:putative transposase
MISNKNYSNSINDVLEFISNHGLTDLNKSLQNLFNELMKIEREQILQAEHYERSELRKGYCNGYKNKTLQTRLSPIDLDVPQTRGINFYPSCLEKGERTERALVSVK